MGKYAIDPDGVKKVLTSTSHDAEKFATIVAPLADVSGPASGHGPNGYTAGIVTTIATGCGSSGAIVPALGEFFDTQSTNLKAMATRINACLSGAAAATSAYNMGDEEMIATYQKNASQLKISEYQPPKK